MADFTKLSDEELLKRYGKLPSKSKPKRKTPKGPGPVNLAWDKYQTWRNEPNLEKKYGALGKPIPAVEKVQDAIKWAWNPNPNRVQQPSVRELQRNILNKSRQGFAELKRRQGLSPEETKKERLERALNQVKTPNVNTPRETVNTDTQGKINQPLNVDLSSTYGSLGKPDPNSPFALKNNPWGLVDPTQTPNAPLKAVESKQSPKLSKEEWLAEQGTKWEQKTANSPAAQSGAWETPGERWDIQKKARSKSWDKKYEAYLKKDETPQLEQNIEGSKDATKKTSIENLGASALKGIWGQTAIGSMSNRVKKIADIAKSFKTVGAAKTLKTAIAGIDPLTIAVSLAINAAKQNAEGTGASRGTGYRSTDQGQEYDPWLYG